MTEGIDVDVRSGRREFCLASASLVDIREVMTWFDSDDSAKSWGGPTMRFPFAEPSFLEDIGWHSNRGCVLVPGSLHFVAYGQYYGRDGRAPLARLAVSPGRRGKGLGSVLVRLLKARSQEELACDESSLFVLENNEAAVRCYRKCGFEFVDQSGEPSMPGMRLMVAGRSDGAPAALRLWSVGRS